MEKGNDEFGFQIVSRGSITDYDYGINWLIEVITLSLNPLTHNEWIVTQALNERDCYETVEEWEEHMEAYKNRYNKWKNNIVGLLEIDPKAGSISITQSLSEIFTVVYIRKEMD